MGQELTQANETLLEFERLIQTGGCNAWEGTLRTGVDLGTANIVLAVVDEQNRPVAGASYPSTVVRDGIVVDYMGAVRAWASCWTPEPVPSRPASLRAM